MCRSDLDDSAPATKTWETLKILLKLFKTPRQRAFPAGRIFPDHLRWPTRGGGVNRFYENLEKQNNYIPLPGENYFSLKLAFNIIGRNPKALQLTLERLWAFFQKPSNTWYLIKALNFVASKKTINHSICNQGAKRTRSKAGIFFTNLY